MRRWMSPIAVVIATSLMPAWNPTASAGQDSAPEPAATSAEATAGLSSTVVLVSGDQVTYTEYQDGTTTVTVEAADRPDGRPVSIETVQSEDGYYAIPTDAWPLLADNTLDPQLFNITTLVSDGLAGADRLPVIVAAGRPGALSAGRLSAVRPTATLTSIGGAAMELGRGEAMALWDELTVRPGSPRATAGGITRVWLDRAVEVSLDQSVPQIGAPRVWDDGHDGSGITVAVLDTGVDPEHPDLAGRVAGTANFTPDPFADGHGHGTHVASIVAGSGAASDGAYRGVAPGADLLVGKVLPNSGSGPTSAVIDGMEWAAQAGADIVNLSLGGPATDGTDPASMAVQALTEQTGALFVIASGNNEGDAAVGSPGAATSALTVGAVDKADTLAGFSNRGPRRGDAAVKPELTAPGAAIVAARAAGTSMGSPVNDHYTSAGGTSMATPHVAGAAALLKQANPDWAWDQLKDALVSTSELGDYTPFQGGAGRLDVANAVRAGVYGPATVNVGAFDAPYDQRRTRPLTYRNHTDQDVTLQLQLSGRAWVGDDLPDGAVALDADTVSVPAGGTATVSVTVDANPGEVGAYTGTITASSGELVLRTPFGYYKSTGSNELTIRAVDFRGDPQSGQPLRAVKLDGAQPNDPFHTAETWAWSDDNGEVRLDVADGRYDVYGSVSNSWDLYTNRLTSMVETELAIAGDAEVELDGRRAVLVNPRWPEPVDLKAGSASYRRGFTGGEFGTGWAAQYSPTEFYMQPAEYRTGWLEVTANWQVTNALVATAEVRGRSGALPITPQYHSFNAAPALAGEHDLELVSAGTGTAGELAAADVAGKMALVRIPVPDDAAPNPTTYAYNRSQQATADAAAVGAAGVLFYIDELGAIAGPGEPRSEEILQLSIPWEQGVRVRAMVDSARRFPVRLALEASMHPERIYRLREWHEDPSLPEPRRQVDVDDLVAVPTRYHADQAGLTQRMFSSAFTPREQVIGGLTPQYWAPFAATEYLLPGEHLRWHREATQLGPPPGSAITEPMQTRELFLPGDVREPEAWFAAPMLTGAADVSDDTWSGDLLCTFCRKADRFLPGLYYTDTDSRHYRRSLLLDGTTYRMFAGDRELPNSGSAFTPWFELDPASATYRLVQEGIQQGVPQARTLAPKVNTEWTFTSSRPAPDAGPAGYDCPFSGVAGGCAFQPLLQLDYDLDLDLLNRAPAGTAHTFGLTIAPHSHAGWTARIGAVHIWYSTDEGKSWTRAQLRPVARDPGRYEITVTHPPLAGTSGYVWLRAEAGDSAGNQVEQTIERAYALR